MLSIASKNITLKIVMNILTLLIPCINIMLTGLFEVVYYKRKKIVGSK